MHGGFFCLVEIHGDCWHILGDGGTPGRGLSHQADDPAGSQTEAGSRADNGIELTAAFTPNLAVLR